MKNRISIVLFSVFTSISSHSIAEGPIYGLGVGVNDWVKIYFPINKGDLLIEPTFSIYNRDNQSSDISSQSNDDYRILEIGIGVFKNQGVSESIYMYYGGRVGYIDRKSSYSSTNSSFTSSSSTEEDGYFIAPTLGVQYYWTSNISIGLDLAFMYSKTDGTNTQQSSSSATTTSDTESTDYNTESEIIVRYYFD